jgi:hypothetical protein
VADGEEEALVDRASVTAWISGDGTACEESGLHPANRVIQTVSSQVTQLFITTHCICLIIYTP